MGNFTYAATEPEWERIGAAIRKAGICGLDTEFWGVDPSEGSCYGPARIHLWSVAVFAGGAAHSPRGYRRGYGATLPASALGFTGFRDLLADPGVTKAVHNLPVDAHAFANHGITLRGAVNTLSSARWYWPELVPSSGGPGFGLKALKQVLLGKPAGPSYKEVFTVPVERWKTRTKKVRRCICGTQGCKLRKGHERYDDIETWQESYIEDYFTPLTDVVPEHPLWEKAIEYAAEDAVDALELWDLCRNQDTKRPMPW